MSLFPIDRLRQIIDQAILLGLASDDRRSVLLAGIDPAYVASLEENPVPRNQLFLDLQAMNLANYRLSTGVPLQIWLQNAAFAVAPQPQTALFGAWAAEVVAQPPPETGQSEQLARAPLESLKGLADADAELRVTIRSISNEFEDVAARLRPFAALKNIHDQLHQFQMSGLWMFQASVRQGSPELVQMAADSTARAVDALLRAVGGEIEVLVDPEEKEEQLDYAQQLRQQQANVRNVAGDATIEAARDALIDLRSVVKAWMEALNRWLAFNASELKIAALIDHLRAFAQALPLEDARAAKLREAASQLALVDAEIRSLVREHGIWQKIDNELWTMEAHLLIEGDALALRTFSRRWPAVVQKVETIGSPGPAPWFADAQQYAVSFITYCPIPVTPPIQAKAVQAFGDYISLARGQFFDVDSALKLRCNRLAALAGPLQKLADTQ